MKNKETLEEAINQELENHFFSNNSEIKQAEYFINFGAKWQQERMYSEEDMKDYANYRLLIKKALNPKEWFEKFKNK